MTTISELVEHGFGPWFSRRGWMPAVVRRVVDGLDRVEKWVWCHEQGSVHSRSEYFDCGPHTDLLLAPES